MTYTYLINIVLLSTILIFYANCQSTDSPDNQTQNYIFVTIDNFIEYISQKLILIHQCIKINLNLEHPVDLIMFILMGFMLRLCFEFFGSKSKFVYNKSDEIDLSIISELKTRELLGLTFKDKESSSQGNITHNKENESLQLESLDSNLTNISNEIKRISSLNQQFGDHIADSHFKLFSLIKDSPFEE